MNLKTTQFLIVIHILHHQNLKCKCQHLNYRCCGSNKGQNIISIGCCNLPLLSRERSLLMQTKMFICQTMLPRNLTMVPPVQGLSSNPESSSVWVRVSKWRGVWCHVLVCYKGGGMVLDGVKHRLCVSMIRDMICNHDKRSCKSCN